MEGEIIQVAVGRAGWGGFVVGVGGAVSAFCGSSSLGFYFYA